MPRKTYCVAIYVNAKIYVCSKTSSTCQESNKTLLRFGEFLSATHTPSGSELFFPKCTYLRAVWKWYMVFSFREVRECSPSSLWNISRPVCPGPVLMTSSPLRNALNQKAVRGRAHFTLSLSHSIPISFWKDLSIIYPLALNREEFSHFLCAFYVHLIPFFCFFLSHRYSPALTC